MRIRRRVRGAWKLASSKKPAWLFAVRDRIAYQSLLTSRVSVSVSLIAVILNVIVAYVAITSLKLNVTTAEQARKTAQAQIDLNKQLADAATRQAEASVAAAKTSQDALSAGQRAWIAPRLARPEGKPELGKKFKVFAQYQNTGREPALQTIYDATLFPINAEDDQRGLAERKILEFQNECKLKWTPRQTLTVYPTVSGFGSAEYLLTRTIEESDVDQDLVGGVKSAVFSGCFTYKTAEKLHRSSFCFFFNSTKSDPAGWNFCATGNEAD